MLGEVEKLAGVETVLVDIRELRLPFDDEGGGIKDAGFSQLCERADAYVIVAPEYNHGYPGSLKHALDTNLKEYIHKAVGLCGVSAGGFGGTRVVEQLVQVVRELGMVATFFDMNSPASANSSRLLGRDLPTVGAPRADNCSKNWLEARLRQTGADERARAIAADRTTLEHGLKPAREGEHRKPEPVRRAFFRQGLRNAPPAVRA